MIQPVVKPVVQPVWQPAVSCKQTSNQPVRQPCWTNSTVRSTGCQTGLYNRFDNRLYTRYSRLSNRFDNRFDNRLYCVNGALQATIVTTAILDLCMSVWPITNFYTYQQFRTAPYPIMPYMTLPHWTKAAFDITMATNESYACLLYTSDAADE